MKLPTAIIFINNEISAGIQSVLETQLDISETITSDEFKLRLESTPDYIPIVHNNNLRVLVILSDFRDSVRNNADVLMYLKNGMATIYKNNFAPPGLTLAIDRINLYTLLRYNGSKQVIILPSTNNAPCQNPIYEKSGYGMGGIVGEELRMQNSFTDVHAPNCDNEFNNTDFKNRK